MVFFLCRWIAETGKNCRFIITVTLPVVWLMFCYVIFAVSNIPECQQGIEAQGL